MPKQNDKIILDTNLWISFLLSRDYSKLDKLFANNSITLLFSRELLEEFIEVAKRPKFKKYFSFDDLHRLLLQIKSRAVFIEVVHQISVCRDPKDDFLLALAKEGKATHLITGDKDLLELKTFGKTKIITIAYYFSQT